MRHLFAVCIVVHLASCAGADQLIDNSNVATSPVNIVGFQTNTWGERSRAAVHLDNKVVLCEGKYSAVDGGALCRVNGVLWGERAEVGVFEAESTGLSVVAVVFGAKDEKEARTIMKSVLNEVASKYGAPVTDDNGVFTWTDRHGTVRVTASRSGGELKVVARFASNDGSLDS